MTEQSLGLLPFYKGWDVYQQHLVKMIAPLAAEQLELQAAPHLRPAFMLASHIITVRAGWLFYVLKEEDPKLLEISRWDEPEEQRVRSAAELVSGLEETWRVIQAGLQRWTPADLDAIFIDTDENDQEVELTRQWVIWHLIEHDIHHGGELSFVLGMHNVKAISL